MNRRSPPRPESARYPVESLHARSPSVRYLVGTPKGRLIALEREFLARPWKQARDQVHVKLLERDNEVYVLARSADRLNKERAKRRRVLKRLIKRLQALRDQELTRDQELMKLGAAKKEAGNVLQLLNIVAPPSNQPRMTNSFQFSINRQKLRQARLREGRYLLRSNLTRPHRQHCGPSRSSSPTRNRGQSRIALT